MSVQTLRREAGCYLRELREGVGLSQRQLADKVDAEYYTFISQLETGRGRIPPDRYEAWAEALNIPAQELVYNLLQFYDPVTFRLLYPEASGNPDSKSTVPDNIVMLSEVVK